MKILITTFTYAPNRDGVSEASRFMAEGLFSKGHSVTVATSSIAGCPDEEVIEGVRVLRFALVNNIPFDRQSKHEQLHFVDMVSKERPDILVNQCWDSWAALLSFQKCHAISAKKVMVSHGFSSHMLHLHGRFPFGIGAWIRGVVWTVRNLPSMIKWYDRIVFLANVRGFGRFFDQTVTERLSLPSIENIPNATSIDHFPPARANFRNAHGVGNGTMILCVANYCERKNQELAVRAFRRANIRGSTLVFIGSEFNCYSKKVKSLDALLKKKEPLGRTIFLENLDRNTTLEAYADCDLFLLTARAETQPIVLIEAMAAGKPWISTPAGCVSTMEGGLVARGLHQIARAIERVVADSELAKSLSREGLSAHRRRYDAAKILHRWETLFRDLVILNEP